MFRKDQASGVTKRSRLITAKKAAHGKQWIRGLGVGLPQATIREVSYLGY